jgi:hypothetical protein
MHYRASLKRNNGALNESNFTDLANVFLLYKLYNSSK